MFKSLFIFHLVISDNCGFYQRALSVSVISGHMLPPKSAQSDLLSCVSLRAGFVNIWTSLHVPQPQALLYKSILLFKAEVSMCHVNSWSPSFVGILPTHSTPVFVLFCCLHSFPLKTRGHLSLEVCILT